MSRTHHSRTPRANARTVALALFAATASACRSERTQIVVVVDTDYAVPASMESVRVSIGDPASPSRVERISLKGLSAGGCRDAPRSGSYCVPLSFLLVPGESARANQAVQVTIEGVSASGGGAERTLVRRAARLPFASGQTLRLPMFLSRACEGVVCPTDFTCDLAQCVPMDRPPGVVAIDPRTGEALDAATPAFDAAVLDASAQHDSAAHDSADASLDATATEDSALSSDATADAVSSTSPCAATSCAPLASIAAGRDFTCVRSTRGAIACWGANDEAQLGRGTTTARAMDGSGGESRVEYVGGISNAAEFAVGDAHACAIWSSGGDRGVSCWGRNARGALGVGSMSAAVSTATAVVGLDARGALSSLVLATDASYVQAGSMVYAWGDNADGAIGFMAPSVVSAPAAFSAAQRWQSPSSRGRGLCWREPPNTICVGRNDGQRFGAVSAAAAVVTTPTMLDARYRHNTLSLSRTFACAIASGRVICWGENRASGVLGQRPSAGDPAIVLDPREVALPSSPRSVVTGGDFALALTNNDRLYCWGSNAEGACATGTQAANGTITPASTAPIEVTLPPGFVRPIRALVAGDGHVCALANDDLPWCWGRNANAQVGLAVTSDPRTRAVMTPTPVVVRSTP
ncbi:MAG: hypothetical protein U0269_21340 [Polyangiales bacterium]